MPCGFVLQGIFSCLLTVFGQVSWAVLCQVFAVGQISTVGFHRFTHRSVAHSVQPSDCRPGFTRIVQFCPFLCRCSPPPLIAGDALAQW